MLFGLEILAATYVGNRLLHRPKKRHKQRPKKITKHTICASASPIATSNAASLTEEAAIGTSADHSKSRLKISSATVALNLTAVWLYPVLIPAGVVALSYTALPIFRNTARNLRYGRKKINNDLLNSTALMGCVLTGSYTAGSIMMWFMYLGDIMVSSIQSDTKKLLTSDLDAAPQTVWIRKDGVELEITVGEVQIGDVLLFNTGEVIAVDGTVIEGMAMIDQHTLTGESAPVERIVGDAVLASTLVVSGRVAVRVEKCGLDTAISQITHILLNTADYKMSLQTRGEKWADKMAKPLLFLSMGLLPFIGIMPAMTVLYSGPGNMLKTCISLQLLSHMTLFSKHGILIKDGRTLEIIPKVDTILFDKTGTLTQEMPDVGEIYAFSRYDENTILRSAAVAEQRLAHPIAKAIVQCASHKGLLLEDSELEASDYTVGYGITVTFKGQLIQVGSLRFISQQNIDTPPVVSVIQSNLEHKGSSLVAVAIDGVFAGVLEICAVLRPEVDETLKALRKYGIKHMAIVSGDHQNPTRSLAEKLGMDDYFYDVLPQGKADIVKKLQDEGRTVCFIGDGVNDAIAIKQAQVSISLSGATTVANDLAQVVLMEAGLSRLPLLFDISKQLKQRGEQSLGICGTYGVSTFIAGSIFHIGLIFPMTVGTANYMAGLAHSALPLLEADKK